MCILFSEWSSWLDQFRSTMIIRVSLPRGYISGAHAALRVQWASNSPHEKSINFMLWSDYWPYSNWSYCKLLYTIWVKLFLWVTYTTAAVSTVIQMFQYSPQTSLLVSLLQWYMFFFGVWEHSRLSAVSTAWFPVVKTLQPAPWCKEVWWYMQIKYLSNNSMSCLIETGGLQHAIQDAIKNVNEGYCWIKSVWISKPPFIEMKVKILQVLIQLEPLSGQYNQKMLFAWVSYSGCCLNQVNTGNITVHVNVMSVYSCQKQAWFLAMSKTGYGKS